MEQRYLINKAKEGWCLSVAHIWIGDDTACTMWSTGGLKTFKYKVYEELPEDCAICQTCERSLEYPEAKNPHIRVSHKRLLLKALGTIICMLCEMRYGWPEGAETEEARRKLVGILREEAWIPKIETPPQPPVAHEEE